MNITIFNDFARRAKEKIEAKKKFRTKEVKLNDFDGITITLKGMTEEQIMECMDHSADDIENDKYMVYSSSKELQELACYMQENGMIKEHMEIMDIFNNADRKLLANEVLTLSGINDKTTVSMVDEVKN